MSFKTVAEAFNYYKSSTIEVIEKRAAEIGDLINRDPKAEIEVLNIELDGLKEAKANIEQRSQGRQGFNPITGMNFEKRKAEEDIFASTEYRNAFYKNLLGQKLTEAEATTYNHAMNLIDVERRADAFNTTTNSAAVLPTATLNEVISKARLMGGLISHCRNFEIPSNLAVPIGTPSNKAAWHVEGKAVESENAATVSVAFNGYEIIKIFSISAAVKKMSVPAFEAYLINELTNCVMECIADALVNGSGTGQGMGILPGVAWNAANSFTYTAANGVTYKDIVKMLGLLKRGYNANAKFAMNNATLYNSIYSIIDTTGRPIFILDPKNENIGYILGKPVVLDDNLPDGVILLGNFDYLGYNLPQGILIETSRESSFKSGLVDYRALAIADTKPLVTEAFVKLSKAATP
jgi:HK97 family phage major capsid protein